LGLGARVAAALNHLAHDWGRLLTAQLRMGAWF